MRAMSTFTEDLQAAEIEVLKNRIDELQDQIHVLKIENQTLRNQKGGHHEHGSNNCGNDRCY